MNFAIYCRKSKYTARGESIENQIDYCTRYIDLTFRDTPSVSVCHYIDEGYSGKSLDRPAFKSMLSDCYAHKIDYIVVYRLDRISRNVADFSRLYQELLDLNVGFISTYERYDTSTSGGRAMLYMSCVFAQLERETVSERVKDSMYSLAKTGRWLGGIAPMGYTSKECRSGGKVRYILSQDGYIHTVEVIYSRYLEGYSIPSIEGYLRSVGIRSPRGNYLSSATIRGILKNPVYCQSDSVSYEYLSGRGCSMCCTLSDCNGCGYMVYGRTTNGGSTSQKRVSESSWIVSIGEHMGVVGGAEWARIQESLLRSERSTRVVHHSNSLLSGMLYCPVCHSKMVSRTQKHGFVYSCSNKLSHGTKACNSPNVDGSIDTILLDSLLNTLPSSNVIPKLATLKQNVKRGGVATISLTPSLKDTLLEGFRAMPIALQREYIRRLLEYTTLNM